MYPPTPSAITNGLALSHTSPAKQTASVNLTRGPCGWVEFIKCMRGAGVQVEALIEYVSLFFQEGTEAARKDILVEQRARLQEQLETLQSTIERLDYKISHYDEMLRCSEKLKS